MTVIRDRETCKQGPTVGMTWNQDTFSQNKDDIVIVIDDEEKDDDAEIEDRNRGDGRILLVDDNDLRYSRRAYCMSAICFVPGWTYNWRIEKDVETML